MSDETRYRCCPHCDEDAIHDVPTNGHVVPCNASDSAGCIGKKAAPSVPVGPTKEGKQP